MTEGDVLELAQMNTDRNGSWEVFRGAKTIAKMLAKRGLLKETGIAPFREATLYVITPAGRRALEEGTGG